MDVVLAEATEQSSEASNVTSTVRSEFTEILSFILEGEPCDAFGVGLECFAFPCTCGSAVSQSVVSVNDSL
jgi:hypothetical protein